MSRIDELENENIYGDNMPDIIRDYLRDDCLSEGEAERYWLRAVKYIEDYTGLKREELEKKPAAVQALLAIAADMHDNRQLSTEKSYVNELVASILGMYRCNLL